MSIGNPKHVGIIVLGMATKIGERIIAARKGRRLSQAEFARRLRIKQPSLSQLESGESGAPSSETLQRMKEQGINPDFIMRGKGPTYLDQIEKQLRDQTLMTMISELDPEELAAVTDFVKLLIRRKPGSSPSDPFKEDPPSD